MLLRFDIVLLPYIEAGRDGDGDERTALVGVGEGGEYISESRVS